MVYIQQLPQNVYFYGYFMEFVMEGLNFLVGGAISVPVHAIGIAFNLFISLLS